MLCNNTTYSSKWKKFHELTSCSNSTQSLESLLDPFFCLQRQIVGLGARFYTPVETGDSKHKKQGIQWKWHAGHPIRIYRLKDELSIDRLSR